MQSGDCRSAARIDNFVGADPQSSTQPPKANFVTKFAKKILLRKPHQPQHVASAAAATALPPASVAVSNLEKIKTALENEVFGNGFFKRKKFDSWGEATDNILLKFVEDLGEDELIFRAKMAPDLFFKSPKFLLRFTDSSYTPSWGDILGVLHELLPLVHVACHELGKIEPILTFTIGPLYLLNYLVQKNSGTVWGEELDRVIQKIRQHLRFVELMNSVPSTFDEVTKSPFLTQSEIHQLIIIRAAVNDNEAFDACLGLPHAFKIPILRAYIETGEFIKMHPRRAYDRYFPKERGPFGKPAVILTIHNEISLTGQFRVAGSYKRFNEASTLNVAYPTVRFKVDPRKRKDATMELTQIILSEVKTEQEYLKAIQAQCLARREKSFVASPYFGICEVADDAGIVYKLVGIAEAYEGDGTKLQGLTLAQKVGIFEQLPKGLKQVHEYGGVAHLDFKPQNFLFTKKGKTIRVAISDLGAAKPPGVKQEVFAKGFTPPEGRGKATFFYDSWALGATILALLAKEGDNSILNCFKMKDKRLNPDPNRRKPDESEEETNDGLFDEIVKHLKQSYDLCGRKEKEVLYALIELCRNLMCTLPQYRLSIDDAIKKLGEIKNKHYKE